MLQIPLCNTAFLFISADVCNINCAVLCGFIPIGFNLRGYFG